MAGIKKIIFTAHGWAFNENRPKWQKFIFWAIQAKTVFFCHQTIAVSETTKFQLKPKWLQKKIVVIHNGIKQENLLSKDEAKEKIMEKKREIVAQIKSNEDSSKYDVKLRKLIEEYLDCFGSLK